MTDHWLSSKKMTVLVKTDENETIVDSAPIVQKFTGQLIGHLLEWIHKQGEFRAKVLDGDEENDDGR